MTFYLPIFGAVAVAAGTILEKISLRKKKIDIKLYQTAVFFAIVLSMLPLIYFFWHVNPLAWQLKNILIFFSVVIFSIIANLLVFYSLKWEKINNLEPARILEPLFIVLLAIILSFFAPELYDRNTKIVIPALIAGLALIFSHIKRHHISFNKYFLAAVWGSFFFALELVISRFILDFYSPISFYFLRSLSIFLLSFLIFRPAIGKLNTKVKWQILLTGAIWMAYRVIVYYGYQKIGVIFTTLLIMLGPIFTYIFAYFILKEKLVWRNIVAALVIIVAVVYSIF